MHSEDDLVATVAAAAHRRRLLDQLPQPSWRTTRLQGGLSTGDLAGLAGVTRQAVYLWESGRRTPRGERGLRYLEALAVLAEVSS